MNVILLEKIRNLGNLGETVKVKRGYGRNYLIPQSKAIPATAANMAEFESRRVDLEKAAKDQLQAHEKRALELEGKQITITSQVSEEGKLYGSIGVSDFIKAAKDAGIEIQRQEINFPGNGHIKELGEYQVAIDLYHGEVLANMQLLVIAASK